MKKRRLTIHHILPGLVLAFTLFVFAPVDLYLSIGDDLWFPMSTLFRWLAIFGAAAFVIITLLAWLLPQKASVALRAAVYACSFLAWLQGNALLLDYGALDGRKIDWSAYTVPYLLDALLWIAVIGLFIFLMFRFRKKFRRVVEIAACVLLATQIISLSVLLIRDGGRSEKTEIKYLSQEGQYTVSAERNTVVFILDCFDSGLFDRLCREYPDEIGGSFADFMFYPDTVGGATRTKYAIPFIFTGETNTLDRSYQAYLSDAFSASPLIRELADSRYDSRLFTVGGYVDLEQDAAIANVAAGVPLALSRRSLTTEYMKLVAFRCLPSALSRFFWTYTGAFEQYKSDIGDSAYGLNDVGFYQGLTSKRLSASAAGEAFRFIHLNGAHEPYTMDENSRSSNRSDEVKQALGALNIVSEYLKQLKNLGLYEQAAVFVMADHGFREYNPNEQTPLFMVKLSNVSHPFGISDLPLSFKSLPEMLTAALRGELDSLEPYRADSTRYFYVHNQRGRKSVITEMTVDGPVQTSPIVKTGNVYYEDTNRQKKK